MRFNFSRIKPNNFHEGIFTVATCLFGILLIPCLIAAAAQDEGTIGTNITWLILEKMYYILSFPTQTLLRFIFGWNASLWVFGLLLNCMLYGFLVERIFFLFRKKTV